MHRFGKYMLTAFVTFALGLACSFLLRNDSISSLKIETAARPSIPVEPRNCEIVSSTVGHGLTSDGFETYSFNYQYSDGTYLNRLTISYGSAARANSEFIKRLEQTTGIIRRELLLDEKGAARGEKAVATFGSSTPTAELLWTDHGNFVIQTRDSLKALLDDLDQKR